jgi:hypothetical protein
VCEIVSGHDACASLLLRDARDPRAGALMLPSKLGAVDRRRRCVSPVSTRARHARDVTRAWDQPVAELDRLPF